MRTVRRGSLIFYQLFTLNNHSLVLCIPTDGETIIRLNISQVADADIVFVVMNNAGELRFLAIHHGRDGGELCGYQLRLCRVINIGNLTVFLPGAAVHAGYRPEVQTGGVLDTSDLLERALSTLNVHLAVSEKPEAD